jgi:hypothetical protein
LKFKVQNDLIQCQEEAEEEADEHLHSHFLGPKFSQSLEQIALLDWLNLIVSRTIPERSAISSEGGKYITVGSSLSSPMCCGCENGSLVGVNHAWNELSTLKEEPNFKAKL